SRYGLRISPDGKMLLWFGQIGRGDSSFKILVAPTNDPESSHEVRSPMRRGMRVDGITWSFDPGRLIYMDNFEGDENTRIVSVDTGFDRSVPLSPSYGIKAGLLKLSPQFPTEALIAHNGRDGRHFDIYRADLLSGQSTLVLENDGFAGFFALPS